MVHPSRVRVTGPLAPHQDAIWTALLARGYTLLSARNLLRVAAHVSRWLQARGLSPQDFTGARVRAFLRHRRSRGYTCWLSPRGLEPILGPLRSHGVVPFPEPLPKDNSPLVPLFESFETFLFEDRGLAEATVARQLRTARRFFAALQVTDLSAVRGLLASDITAFVLREAQCSSIGSAKLVVTDLRSLLRFLHVQGHCNPLAGAVPAVAGRRLARLPRHIPWKEVQRLLDSCDPRTAAGMRDHAILLLLARLGLRAAEVAALELGDIHWSGGQILVRGKGSRHGALPLSHDVGAAISHYLQCGRPPSTSRRLFLKSRAPQGDLCAGTVQAVVRSASRRAQLPLRSAHQLRHTAATQMLRGGASLQAIAEVLRHQSLDTTAIYAKVDHLALRPLARPWPGGGA